MRPTPERPSAVVRALSIAGVSVYLGIVAVLLIVTRRVPGPGTWLRTVLRGRYRGKLETIVHEVGHCFVAPVPERLVSDADGVSRLVVLEDGTALPVGHAPHEDIRREGGGRYSHWGAQVYFSTSDRSDPLTNGRRYAVEERA